MRFSSKVTGVLGPVFVGLLLWMLWSTGASPAQAQEKSFSIERWETVMDIQSDGDIEVAETQTVRFNGSFSFYVRSIAHQRLDDITDISVIDETASETLLPMIDYQVSESFSGAVPSTDIRINFALTDAVQTWTINYTVKGGLGFFEDHDELYWNVIPSDRSVPIGEIEATVNLAGTVAADDIQTLFFEDAVANQAVEVVDGDTVVFTAGTAQPFTDFTIVVGWPTGLIERPGVLRVESFPTNADVLVDGQDTFLNTPVGLRTGLELTDSQPHQIQVRSFGVTSEPITASIQAGEVQALELQAFDTFLKKLLFWAVIVLIGIYILLPGWLTIILVLRWRKTGRDPKGRGTIIAEFEPPDNAEPGIVGTLYDERADVKDLTATVVDLAVRGYLEINELPKKGLFSTTDYEFVKKKDFEEGDLKAYEKEVLVDLFGSKDKKKLSELKRKFYSKLPDLQKELYAEVMQQNYFVSDPDKRRKKYKVNAGWMISFGLIGSFFFGLGIPLLLAGVVVSIFSRLAPQRTKTGVLATEKAEGFKLYLHTAERYRLQKMTPEIFERFLPYAMVFGVEKEWARKFKDIYKDIQPTWYHSASGQPLNAFILASAMSNWNTAATTAMASRPGGGSSSGGFGGFASGSSGFSGGFSGGGGGGGGVSAG